MTLVQFCFCYKGRINRTLYWAYAVISLLFLLGIGAVSVVIDKNAVDGGGGAVILSLKLLLMDLPVTVKRLHDTNTTGWCSLIGLIPIVGVVYLFVICGFVKGTEGDNYYGSPVSKIT